MLVAFGEGVTWGLRLSPFYSIIPEVEQDAVIHIKDDGIIYILWDEQGAILLVE